MPCACSVPTLRVEREAKSVPPVYPALNVAATTVCSENYMVTRFVLYMVLPFFHDMVMPFIRVPDCMGTQGTTALPDRLADLLFHCHIKNMQRSRPAPSTAPSRHPRPLWPAESMPTLESELPHALLQLALKQWPTD